ncbi:hypothetical protein D3C85_853980 [compost metagenome]
MDIGTKVRVVARIADHRFRIDEIVTRVAGKYDDSVSVAFESKQAGVWYMIPNEYVVVEQKQVDTIEVPRELIRQAVSDDRTLRATARFALRSLLNKDI